MCQHVRIPKCCDTLIYSCLTVPKGDCNIKYDCPFLQHMTLCFIQHTCEESLQRKFHFLLSGYIFILKPAPVRLVSFLSFFVFHFLSPSFSAFIFYIQFTRNPGIGLDPQRHWQCHKGNLNGLRVCCQGDKANKLLCCLLSHM